MCATRQLAEGEAPRDRARRGAGLRDGCGERSAGSIRIAFRLWHLLAGVERRPHACRDRDLPSDLTGTVRRGVHVDVCTARLQRLEHRGADICGPARGALAGTTERHGDWPCRPSWSGMDVGCHGGPCQAAESQLPGHGRPCRGRVDTRGERPPSGPTSPVGVGTSCAAFKVVATLMAVAWPAPLAPPARPPRARPRATTTASKRHVSS
jgi:hypothetical protein